MESRARRSLARRLNVAVELLPSTGLEATLASLKRRYVSPGVCQFLERRLQGLLGGLVAELLVEAGLSAERVPSLGGRLYLTEDMVRLLAWNLHMPVLELLQRQHQLQGHAARLDDAELVRLFEGRCEHLRRVGRSVLNRLHGWLVELAA